jgi:hypothetical protein
VRHLFNGLVVAGSVDAEKTPKSTVETGSLSAGGFACPTSYLETCRRSGNARPQLDASGLPRAPIAVETPARSATSTCRPRRPSANTV